ncbi:fimbria/pilus periplasmic chaperone [Diaphorobacter sp.]|uniref:fimbrial biogenesis chaperone n=1 Tax=Diaphorobacter sp. TaxID=1934310 RepID=UPI0028AD149F|nr:fimbria/pilus periplasmic chaperone [Diaphorobacter sp.]
MTRLPLHRATRTMISAAALGAFLLLTSRVMAGGLEVSPTTLQITSQQSAEGITLSNVGDTPLHAQVRVFAWSQKDNEDLLTPSTGITVSPPMLQIAPGASQLLRVIRSTSAPTGGSEQTYRLIIDEIPSPAPLPSGGSGTAGAKKASGTKSSTALDFYMRYSLPVFVGDTNDNAPSSLTWQLATSPRQWTLSVHNVGQTRAQIADIAAVLPNEERKMLFSGLAGYVLAGQSRSWTISAPDEGQKVIGLEAMINRKVLPVHADLAR